MASTALKQRHSIKKNVLVRSPEYSTQFRRDVKRMQKRGKDVSKLKTLLIEENSLPQRYKDHSLSNDWSAYRDAHIEPDWLLIYWRTGEIVRFERTGTHSDLFS